MKRIALVFTWLLLFAVASQAQTPAPKPAPEMQRLANWIGTWKTEGAKSSGTVTWEWFTGGFGIVGRAEDTGPEGKSSALYSMSYDPAAKEYTTYALTSSGPGGRPKCTVTGNTWLWQWDGTVKGKPAKYRLTVVEATPTSQTWKREMSVDGGPWTVSGEGKSTKVK